MWMLPDTVRVGHIRFRIRPMTGRELEEGNDGFTRGTLEEIALHPEMPPDRAAEVLLHEILHAVYHVRGLKDGMAEERIVTDMAPTLLEVLRDNPRVLRFLLKPNR